MKTPPGLVAKVITQHGLNTLAAWDQGERLRLFFREGTPDQLVEDLEDLVRQLDGVFLVKAWKRTPKQSGRRPDSAATYSWLVQGTQAREGAIQGIPGSVPDAVVNELAQLRAEALVRERMAQDAQDEDEDEDEEEATDPALAKLVDIIQGLLIPKAPAPGPAGEPVQGAERGHPSALTKERMARILTAVRNLHTVDPATFAQYEAALLQTYGERKTA